MRTLEPPNRTRIGLMGLTVVLLVIAFGQTMTSVPMLFASAAYYGQFTDTGGMNKGDKVRIAGVNVGVIQSMRIDGDHIVMKFTTGGKPIGAESRLTIRTDTLLGRRVLEIDPRGTKMLRPNTTLPVGQSAQPYQLYDAVFDVTKAASDWDIDTVKQSLNVLSQTINQTSPHLSAALDGIAKFSDTVGKRDEEIKHLLAQANQVASVLGDRSDQVDRLLVNTKTLLVALNARGQAIDALLSNIASFSYQVQQFINDNPNLNHVLEQLRTVSDLLREHKQDLADGITKGARNVVQLGETIASGPYFKIQLANLLPYQLLQPYVDAAFKKRGIDPEEFYRNAGLPAYRFPDPNGTRFPNGAPPPAPPVLEGTPDHPGPAVAPGSPCSYTPTADGLPRPWNPLPCAGTDQNLGPFGVLAGPLLGVPDLMVSPPNPNGLPPTPGIPIAGRPGEPAPDVPGTPVPLPPNAPPGARTENLQPAGPTPPPSTFAPGYPPQPPAPPGPGQQLPAPFINPGGSGGSGAAGGSQN
jgi:phospholipid/cholesterol/gamma-HCH transport system substrate-binding protein